MATGSLRVDSPSPDSRRADSAPTFVVRGADSLDANHLARWLLSLVDALEAARESNETAGDDP